MQRAVCKEFRERMLQRVAQVDPDGKACVALSGGLDSVTVLFALLAAGRKPRCYTFFVKGHQSQDLVSSIMLCEHFNLEHVSVAVPMDDHRQIVEDVRKITEIQQADKIKKTIIQCLHPWLYVVPEMQKRGDDQILIGFAAGNFFNLSRRDQKELRKVGEEEFRNSGWRDHYFEMNEHNLQFVDANVRYMCRASHIMMEDFYAVDEICDWFKSFDVAELHTDEYGNRFEKAPLIYAFADYYSQGAFYRPPSSYQVNSSIREFHDGLLANEEFNPERKHKAIIGIYNDIAQGRI